MSQKIVTRFAPSPTGYLHMGGVRTALFAYLFARRNGGKFILRIEDTDKERSKKEFEDGIVDGMKWLGLSYDEFYRQSDRGAVYKKYIEKLLAEGKAYVSKEELPAAPSAVAADGAARTDKRDEVVRFKNPNKIIKFTDLIRGEIKFDTTELGDFVIAKSVDEPVFHLAVAVDDYEMGISHVIRGEDHISNTPRHILIFEAIGAKPPTFAHLPLVLAPDRSKLSKRKHGEMVALEYYRERGYLPEAIINFLALIGWSPGGNDEFFSLEKLAEIFDLSHIQKGGAVFNVEKLDWFNREYVKRLDEKSRLAAIKDELRKAGIGQPGDKTTRMIDSIVTGRISRFAEVGEMVKRGEFSYLFAMPRYAKEKLLWQGSNVAQAKNHLTYIHESLAKLADKEFKKENIKDAIFPYADKEGRGNVLWPMRFALTGLSKSPDPFSVAEMLGKKESLIRLDNAVNLLS